MSYRDKVRRVEGHDCNLPQDEELITLYINGGLCVDLRRKIRKYMMVSASNPESKTILRSTAQIRMEESRHLRKYYCMIHPFSKFRITWEMLMIVVYSALMVVMPIDLGLVNKSNSLIVIKIILDAISLIDIVLFFFTGFYNIKVHKIIMKPSDVAIHYLCRRFIFDFVSSIPYQIYVDYYAENPDVLYRIKYLYIVKLTRLPTLILYIRKFCIRLDIYTYKLTILNYSIWFVTLTLWCSSGILLQIRELSGYTSLSDYDAQKLIELFIKSAYEIVKTFMLVEMNEIEAPNTVAMCFNVLCILIGVVLNVVIFALVMKTFRRHFSSKNKYENLIQQITEYMECKELPGLTKKRVFQYVEFKFQKNVFKESEILNNLSKIIQQDILLHNCKKMIERVDFFKNVPSSLILRLVTKLKAEIFLPNDVIVQAGIPGNAMYFIYVGCVAVYTASDTEICHLEDGSHFGEISLIINEPRVASVVAVTNCEVYKLSRKDFLEAIAPFPNLSDKIKESALERLKNTQSIMQKEGETRSNT